MADVTDGNSAFREQVRRVQLAESGLSLRLAGLIEQVNALHSGDDTGAAEWLRTPIPALGGRSPLEAAATDSGAQEVGDLIGRIACGIAS